MSLRPLPPFAIPEETQRVAHAAFPKGTLCLRIADELGDLYRDDQFAELFPNRGQPAASPARGDATRADGGVGGGGRIGQPSGHLATRLRHDTANSKISA